MVFRITIFLIFFTPLFYSAQCQSGIFGANTYSKHKLENYYKKNFKAYLAFDTSIYQKNKADTLSGKPAPSRSFTILEENEVSVAKRIWRCMDFKENINNKIFNTTNARSKQNSLIDAITFGVITCRLVAYKTDDFTKGKENEFAYPDIVKKLITQDTIVEDYFDETEIPKQSKKIIIDTLSAKKIKQFWIKEDWIFNRFTVQVEKRIIGLAPVIFNEKTQKYEAVFWINFYESKDLLNSFLAVNPNNTDQFISFREALSKHYFIYTIIKESNVYDRNTLQNTKGLETLLESESIKERERKKEESFWEN